MNRNKLLIFAILMVLLIGNVYALGITPARTTINFEPSIEHSGKFTIINSDNKDINLMIYLRGDLNEYINLYNEYVSMKSNQETKEVGFEVKLPENLEPGPHKAEIVVLEIPETQEGQTKIDATLAVVKQIIVNVPYPGKYLDADMNIYGLDTKTFEIGVVGRGQENIGNAYAEIYIYDNKGTMVATLNTNNVPVNKFERKDLVATWTPDVDSGIYSAKAIIYYDGNEKEIIKEFEIGEFEIELQDIYVTDFKIGEIAKFNLVVKNKWNEMIKNVYAEMDVYDNEMNKIGDVKSASYNLPSDELTTMVYYWDTKDLSTGVYDANIILNYEGKKVQQKVTLDVRETELLVFKAGYVISEAESPGGNIVGILIAIIIVLIIINFMWFFVLRNMMKNKGYGRKLRIKNI
jgi:hypothetical protein